MNIETLMKVQFPEELERYNPIIFHILEIITQPWAKAFLYRDIDFAVAAIILEHRMRSYITCKYEKEYNEKDNNDRKNRKNRYGTITTYNNFFTGLRGKPEGDSFAKKYHNKGFPKRIEIVATRRNDIMHGRVENIEPQQKKEAIDTIEDFCTTFPHPCSYITADLSCDSLCPKCKKLVSDNVTTRDGKKWCPCCKSLFE